MYYPEEQGGYSLEISIAAELLIDDADEFMEMYMDLYNNRNTDMYKREMLACLLTAMVTFMDEDSFRRIEDMLPSPLVVDYDAGYYVMEIFQDDEPKDYISKFLMTVEKNLLLRGFEMKLEELFDYYEIEDTNFYVTAAFTVMDLSTNGDAISEEFNGAQCIHDGIYGILNEFDYDMTKFFDYYVGEME